MGRNRAVVWVCLVVAWISSSALAVVDTRAIDGVRAKTMLDDKDRKTIDEFLDNAVREILRTRDFSMVSKTLEMIVTRRSPQAEYADQFSKSARKYIASGLAQAASLPEDRGFKVVLNLLILAERLDDPSVVEVAIDATKDPREAIRYRAVSCLTSPAVVGQLTKDAQSPLAGRIVPLLKDVVQDGSPEVLAVVCEFAGKVAQAQHLLSEVADIRIAQYADGTVKQELVDTVILKALCSKIMAGGADKAQYGRRFGQLYSYLIQRYAKAGSSLSETQRQQVVSVIAEIEDKCINPMMGGTQPAVLRKALEKGDLVALMQEHDRLLGGVSTPGEIPAKIQFDYGPGKGGSARTSPIEWVLKPAAK